MGSICSGEVERKFERPNLPPPKSQNRSKPGEPSPNQSFNSSNQKSKSGEFRVSKTMFIQQNENSFDAVYKRHPKALGSGAFGEVWLCDHKITQETRAVKILLKEGMSQEEIDNRSVFIEVEILKALDHPNILKVFEYFEDEEKYYIVMEYCKNGDIFEMLEKKGKFSEKMASKVMKQLFSALNYLHKQKIIHRDVKPENLLLGDSLGPEDIYIKLIDFNISTSKKDELDVQGTIDYMAPEVFTGNYDEKCDVWGAGVILYALMSGDLPFGGGDDEDVIKNHILNKKIVLDKGTWTNVSPDCKDLIRKTLERNPSNRLSSEQALKHPWIIRYIEGIEDHKHFTKTLTRIRTISDTGMLKQVISTFIISQISKTSSTRKLESIFHNIDKNGDGVISRREMLEALKNDLPTEEAEKEASNIFKHVNTDEKGNINYTEFLRISMEEESLLSVENIKKAFKFLDKDGSGSIEKDELVQWLGSGGLIPDEISRKLIAEADHNGDGTIDIEEFEQVLISRLDLEGDGLKEDLE